MISSLQRLWGLPGSEDNDEITSASRQTHSLWTTWTTTEMLIDWNSSEELTFISSHWFCTPNSYSSRGVFFFLHRSWNQLRSATEGLKKADGHRLLFYKKLHQCLNDLWNYFETKPFFLIFTIWCLATSLALSPIFCWCYPTMAWPSCPILEDLHSKATPIHSLGMLPKCFVGLDCLAPATHPWPSSQQCALPGSSRAFFPYCGPWSWHLSTPPHPLQPSLLLPQAPWDLLHVQSFLGSQGPQWWLAPLSLMPCWALASSYSGAPWIWKASLPIVPLPESGFAAR